MAAEPKGTRSVIGREDPGRLLGVGEAADLLRVAHMELRRAIREGRLPTTAGRRRGRLVRLLRVSDLARIHPRILHVSLPPLEPTVEVGSIVVGIPPPAETPAAPPAAPPAETAAVQETREEPGGDEVDDEIHPRDPLDRLPEELHSARDQNRRLFRELRGSARQVRELHAQRRTEEQLRVEVEQRLERERRRADLALGQTRRLRRLAYAVGSVLVSALAIATWQARGGGLGSPVHAGEGLPRLPPLDLPYSGPFVGELIPSEPLMGPPVPADWGPAGRRLPQGHLSTPVRPADQRPAAGRAPAGYVPLSSPGGAGRPVPPPGDHAGSAPGFPSPPPDPSPSSVRSQPPGAIPSRVPRAGPGDDRPCAYHRDTRPGGELRGVLGPCMGTWSPDLEAVVGDQRQGGRPFCRHHAFFMRSLGGSLDRARSVAALSREEGLLPPLVQLRVDRAGVAFLRRTLPTWLASGFEEGPPGDHRVTPLGPPDAWCVESWVRVEHPGGGGGERRRTFRMELVVVDGPGGDRLIRFRWTD